MKKLLLSTLLVVALLPLSANAQEGKAVLKNKASGLYWAAGNNWGTRASLMPSSEYQTLHIQPDGTYQMETHVNNGGTSYYFAGDYMDGNPVNLTLTQKGDYYTVTSGSASYGNSTDAGSYKDSYILGKNASGEDALWEIVFEDEWGIYLCEASENNKIDATFYILDANFGRNNRHSSKENNDLGQIWTMESTNQNLSGGTNENRCAESWRAAFTLSQTVNVPNGKYIVQAQAAMTEYTVTGRDLPVVYANNETSTFLPMTERENSMNTMSNQFAAGKYEVNPITVEVTDGKLTIGVRGTRNDTWCIWDNFRLTCVELAPAAKAEIIAEFAKKYQSILAKVESLANSEERMSQSARDALQQALTDYSNIDVSSVSALKTAIKSLNNAITMAETSISNYKRTEEALTNGYIPDNSLDGWVCTNSNAFHINTWSVEADNPSNDPSGMVKPFIENWVGSGDILGAGQVYYTLYGLEPGTKVKATALVRVYNEAGGEISGATYFSGDDQKDISAEGTPFNYEHRTGVYGTFSAIGKADADGFLKFGVDITNPTFNWVSIKDVKLEIVPPSSDVTFTSFIAPGRVLINEETQDFEVNLSIINQGDIDAKNVVVKLFDGEGLVASSDPIENLTTGEPVDLTLTYNKELVHGKTLRLYATVECDEENENYIDNNQSESVSVKLVMDGSDVTVTGTKVDNVIRMGEEDTSVDVEVTVTVKNLGTQPADGVVVQLKDAEGNVVASSEPVSVEAGQEQEVVVVCTVTEAGTYEYEVSVTADADIDEENNTYSEPVTFKVKKTGELVDGIDVEALEIEAEGANDEGGVAVDNETGGVTINVTVANNGKETAKGVVVTLYVNGEEYATNADVEGFENIDLEGADEVVVPFFVEIPEFTDYEVYAEVAAEGDIDEENNVSETLAFTAFYEGIDVALLDVTYPEAISVDSEEDAIVVVIVKNISEDSRVSDDSELKAENVVVHLYIDGVEVATSKPFSLYKAAEAHAYLGIDRKYLTSENVILTARVTADGDGNESNDWSEELPIQVSGVVTGIDSILARFGQNAQVYTLDGKKVDLSSGMLKKGLYIINGKKTAIK